MLNNKIGGRSTCPKTCFFPIVVLTGISHNCLDDVKNEVQMQLLTPMIIDFVKTNAHIFYMTESFLIPLNLDNIHMKYL